jgi:hypothetical protein
MIRLPTACAWLLPLAIAGCAYPSSPRSHTDQATIAACRKYASQVYDRMNRGTIYSIDQTGLPYSGSYLAGNQTNTLADRYANENRVDDCIRNTDTNVNRDNPDSDDPITEPKAP